CFFAERPRASTISFPEYALKMYVKLHSVTSILKAKHACRSKMLDMTGDRNNPASILAGSRMEKSL
ncbi:MAG TPA: hypothetical protein VIJ53_06550, partial [Acidobacteriaceae bacterium]